jgi:hypothetical protein
LAHQLQLGCQFNAGKESYMHHSGLFILTLVGGGLAVFVGTILLIALASLLAVIPYFLLASLAQLISVMREKWKNRETPRVPQRDVTLFNESNLWTQEFRQNIANRALPEVEERRAS